MSLKAPTTGSSDFVPTGSTDTLRFCSLCKKSNTSKFKLCNNCREKNRDAARRNRIRKVLASVNTKERVDAPAAKLGRVVGQTSINGSSEMVCTEYQTCNELFRALKSLTISTSPLGNSIGQFLQFHGSYTIVAAADIDNFRRLCLLAAELCAKVRLPFRYRPLSAIGDESSQTVCFGCACMGNAASTVTMPHNNNENGENVSSATSTNDSSTIDCGGMITLKSIVDNTHPLGIPGQHIVVRVEHQLMSRYHPTDAHPPVSKT